MRRSFPLLLACLSCPAILFSGPATEHAAQFAPTGTLRATFLGNNPVQARVDAKTSEITGPIADLTKELARRLGVPYKITPSPDARSVIDSLKNHTADIGFLAYHAPRAVEVDYAGPFELMLNSYVVAADSPAQKSSDLEKSGITIGAVPGQTQAIYLAEHLKNATLRMFPTQPPAPELQRLFASGELHAFAMNRQRALELAGAEPSLRALPDSFLEVEQEFVLEKGSDPAKLTFLNQFVEELRASGFLKSSIERAKIVGAEVARPH